MAGSMIEHLIGVYKGIVTNAADPEGLGRVKAIVPQVFGDPTTESEWAWPCGNNPPAEGTGVWVTFEGGDIDYPVWLGTWEPGPVPSGGDFISVKDYGAVGDGATDDTAAIISAITAASVAGGGIVFFPAARYLISSTLVVPTLVTLLGVNEWVEWGSAKGSVLVVSSTMSSPLIELAASHSAVVGIAATTISGNTTAPVISIPGTSGNNISDVSVRRVFSANLGGVLATYLTRSVFEDVVLQGWHSTNGFDVTNGTIVYFNRCNSAPGGVGTVSTFVCNYSFTNCGTINLVACEGNGQPYYSFFATGTVDSECWNFEANGATQDQIHIVSCVDWSFSQCYLAQTSVNGMYISQTQNARIMACHFDNWTASALVLDGGSSQTKDITFAANFVAWESNLGPIISVTNTPVWNVAITGNAFEGAGFSGGTWIEDQSTHTGRFMSASGNVFNRAIPNTSINVTTTGSVWIAEGNTGYNPTGPQTPPGVPGSTSPQANTFPFSCEVYITAGAGSTCGVKIGSTTVCTLPASGIGSFYLSPGETITLTYTSTPTWAWVGV